MTALLQAVISRPRPVLTLMVFMIAAGVMSFLGLPREANPDIDVPVYYISIPQKGISANDAARLLLRPMERHLRGLDGLEEMTATASEGHAGVYLEFDIQSDPERILADIRDKVDQARTELPDQAEEPTITGTNLALEPTIIVALSGDVPQRTLSSLAHRLRNEIEAISTVHEANLKGHREELLEVELDLMKLESYDISPDLLVHALERNNQLVAAGFIDGGNGRFNVKVPGLLEEEEDVSEIPIRQNGEGVVTIGDVSELRRTFADPSTYTRVNGKPAIAIEVTKRIGANIVENSQRIRAVVQSHTADWPGTIRVNYLFDESDFIFEVLGSLQSAIMTAIVLVMICVIGTLGFRSGILVGLAIPSSFMIAFLFLGALGMTLNMMIMFGMVLTVGMLVDGAIVVIEYADRKMSEGMSPAAAYRRASKVMFWPVVSSTATTLAAFLPLLLWPGVTGEFMSYLPRMVIIVLVASLLTALVFLPVAGTVFAQVAAYAAKRPPAGMAVVMVVAVGIAILFGSMTDAAPSMIVAGVVAVAVLMLVPAFTFGSLRRCYNAYARHRVERAARGATSQRTADTRSMGGIVGLYLRMLRLFTGSVLGNVAAMVLIAGTTVAIGLVYFNSNKGVEFFVDEEPDLAIVLVLARGNLSVSEVHQLVQEVETEVLQVDGIDNVLMSATAPRGDTDIVGELEIELTDYCCRGKASGIFGEIRRRTADLAGIKVEVYEIEGGPSSGKDIHLEIKSNDYGSLVRAVRRVRRHFDTEALLTDQEDGLPLPGIDWEISVDRKMAGRYKVGSTEIGSVVQLVTNGVLIGSYRPDDSVDELDIRMRLPREQRTLDHLETIRLSTEHGRVPLSNFTERTARSRVASIVRRDGLFAMDVRANLADGARFEGRSATADDAVGAIQAWIDTQTWPDEVFLRFRGTDEEQRESGAFLLNAAFAALFMMFVILLTQFNSFYQSVLTLSTVILAAFGVLLGMVITGQRFSIIMTGTGIVALSGIVVNNAIVLIDTYNRTRREGEGSARQAVLMTSAHRVRPIMLTTITTILGLIPMALQTNFNFFDQTTTVGGITAIWWVQLSTAIIFGLAYSTVLTLLLVPSMLVLPENLREMITALGGRTKR